MKEWRESLLNRSVKTSNICAHKNCKRSFPTKVARNTHNGTVHRCHEKCLLCEEYEEKHKITPPCEEVEEKDEEKDTPTYLTMDEIFPGERPTKFRKLNDGDVGIVLRAETMLTCKVDGEYCCFDYRTFTLSICTRIDKIKQWIKLNVSSHLEYFNVLVNLTAGFWCKLLTSSFEEALQILRKKVKASNAIIESTLYNSGLFKDYPTLEAFLQFKEELKITDNNKKKLEI